MDTLFLIIYLTFPILMLLRSRSIAWLVITLAASVSGFGLLVSLSNDFVRPLSRIDLQVILAVAMAVPAVITFLRYPRRETSFRHQFLSIGVPVLAIAGSFTAVTTLWTDRPAYLTPVSFLMGHSLAEDNAKWLDFTSSLASGTPIEQAVPMGGPLQLVLVFVATAMGVLSLIVLGGYNEVMVAANTVIFGQYLFVAMAPLALAPLAEARVQRTSANGTIRSSRIPWSILWTGILVLVTGMLIATIYGHLTWQFTAFVTTLWITTYLAASRVPRAALLTSLVVAAGMTVWLPMNVIAVGVIVGWLFYLLAQGIRGRGWDRMALGLVVAFGIALWEPIRSSFAFVLGTTSAASETVVRGAGAGVRAVVSVVTDAGDASLFAAGGGTERTTAILAGIAVVVAIAAAVMASRQAPSRGVYTRMLPVAVLTGFAVALNLVDQWVTGNAPNYGSLKFTFLVAIVVSTGCLPFALLLLDSAKSGMTLARWTGIGAVVFLLTVDPLMVRSIGAVRPEQWSPPIPFDNPQSYWWPADVNGTSTQPIADNPIACVYLPQGAVAPSGILDSKLSDPQRVYSCTRLLAGLGADDTDAQPLVDWLRREWLLNTRQWSDVHGYLSSMPESVLNKRVILLDDGSNVIGLDTMGSLLARYPASTGVSLP